MSGSDGITLDRWRASAREFAFGNKRIRYWTAGEGEPLLLIHGFPTASWDWHKVWHPLAARYRLIACDMLGFGYSAKTAWARLQPDRAGRFAAGAAGGARNRRRRPCAGS